MDERDAEMLARKINEERKRTPNGGAFTSAGSPWWAKLLEILARNFGFGAIVSVAMFAGLYYAGVAVWRDFVVPWKDNHFQLIETVVETSENQTEEMRKQTRVLEGISTSNRETTQAQLDTLRQSKVNEAVLREMLRVTPSSVLEAVERVENKLDNHVQEKPE